MLEEVLDYIRLNLLAAGNWSKVQIRVSISRQQVTAAKLRPHVDAFRAQLAAIGLGRNQFDLQGTDEPAHRVDLIIWR